MRSHRRLLAITLALVPALMVSCTSSNLSENTPPSAIEQPSLLLSESTEPVVGLTDVSLLTCKPQKHIVASKEIGRKGGEIRVGTHTLVIPRSALSAKVTITAEQMPGYQNTVRLRPEGLRFERPAQLTMSYDNCDKIKASKKIVYTDEVLKILQLLPGKDNRRDKTVTTPLEHFSRYAVAF